LISLPKEVTELLENAKTHQEEAWLNFNSEIDGVEIKQMSLRHFFILQGLDSPFLTDNHFTYVDIGIFCWILSPEFQECPKARDKFCEKVRKVRIGKAIQDIERYLEITFLDADTSDVKNKKRYANFVAYQIDTYAKEYGWSADTTMDMPLRQIFQLNNAIAERYAELAGTKYSMLRNIDMVEAKAMLDSYRQTRDRN
jgi:hypothetical protein